MTDNTGLPRVSRKDDSEDIAHGAALARISTASTGTGSHGTAPPKSAGLPRWIVAMIGVVILPVGIGLGTVACSGDSSGDEAAVGSTTSSDETRTSDGSADDEIDNPEQPSDVSDGAGSAENPRPIDAPWTYKVWKDGTQWEGSFEGLVSVPIYDRVVDGVHEYERDKDARCYAIVGTMSPTFIEDGAPTTSQSDVPNLDVVVGGEVSDEYGGCDYEALEAAGYQDLFFAEVSAGAEFKFYEAVFLPSTIKDDIELIVLGYPDEGNAVYYQPTETTVDQLS